MTLAELKSNDLELLTEGLQRLRDVKVQAHTDIVKVPGHERFTPSDFGVPQIDALLEKLEAAYDSAPD